MKKSIFFVLLTTLFISGCFASVDPKEKGAVQLDVRSHGKLLNISLEGTTIDWTEPKHGRKDEIEKKSNELAQTMEFKKKTKLPGNDFLALNYEYVSIFIPLRADNPEDKLIVKNKSRYYSFKGDKEKTEFVIEWVEKISVVD